MVHRVTLFDRRRWGSLTGLIPGLTLGIIGIAGVIVALVYLFDVRVRIAEITS